MTAGGCTPTRTCPSVWLDPLGKRVMLPHLRHRSCPKWRDRVTHTRSGLPGQRCNGSAAGPPKRPRPWGGRRHFNPAVSRRGMIVRWKAPVSRQEIRCIRAKAPWALRGRPVAQTVTGSMGSFPGGRCVGNCRSSYPDGQSVIWLFHPRALPSKGSVAFQSAEP